MSRLVCSLLFTVAALLATDAFAGQPLPKVSPLPASAADIAAATQLPVRPLLPARTAASMSAAAQPVALPHAEVLKMVAAKPRPNALLADLFASVRPVRLTPPAPVAEVNVASR